MGTGKVVMKVSGVIFDCDGTLLDSAGMWTKAQEELARRAQVELGAAESAKISTLTIPEVGVFFHEHYGLAASSAAVVAMIDELMLDYYTAHAIARPGALAFVQGLHERGIPCAVASSSPQHFLQAGLRHSGFMDCLDAIVSVDDVGASKREVAVYDRARDVMGATTETSWGFEDSLYAVHTLRAGGYRSVGVFDTDDAGTYEQLEATADFAIRSFEELNAAKFILPEMSCQAFWGREKK
ncbi:MAG: HAD family phosphatase [Raoultibacter sp.]